MKIGIEAQRIFRKKKHGMDIVALELIRNLQVIDTKNEYFIFVMPDEDNSVIKETPNFKIIELPGGPYPVWEQILLPYAAKKYGCDVLHCTSNTAPLFTGIPLVVTLHDIIFMESSVLNILMGKGSNYQKFGNVYRRLIVPFLIKKCKKIITVSDFEKKCISEFFGLSNDERLLTIYNGVSDYFMPVTDALVLKTVKEKYNLPNQFFFFLGNTHPKKNTIGVLKAFSDFLKQTPVDVKLVMIDFDKNELKKLLQSIGDTQLINQIHVTGYVNNKDLPAIYSQCRLFLYPSLRESFGIPIIEAMACGAPLITSDTSSMPEVGGDAAVLVDPFKPATITEAMHMVNNNVQLREGMRKGGFIQSAKFSWKNMAAAVLQIYNHHKQEQELKLNYGVQPSTAN